MNPPSSRLGFVWPVALAQKVLGDRSERAGAVVSLIASVVTVFFIGIAGYLLGGIPLAVTALTVAIFFPFSIAMARRSWTDGLMECLGIIAVTGALLLRERGVAQWIGFILSFSASFSALWVKESGYVVSALCILPAFSNELSRSINWRSVGFKLLAPVSGTILGFLALSWVLGGLDQIPQVFHHLREAVPKAVYAREYQDGPWYDFILAWRYLAPATLVLLFVSWPFYLFSKGAIKEVANYIPLWLIVGIFMIPPCVMLYYKNIRYLSPIYGVLVILLVYPAAMAIAALIKNQRWLAGGILYLLLLTVILFDYRYSTRLMIERECQDLNLRMLRECHE
jgi:hypothetical protein